MQPRHLPVAPGSILDGKYRILDEVLGVGSMGVVVAALHVPLDRRVAIKFMLPEIAKSGEAAIRFLLEARAASKVGGEHATHVLDAGRLEGSGLPYTVMERVDGPTLAELLRRMGFLEVDTAVDFVLQACEGLSFAHASGIVHRDLKPENLILFTRSDGRRLIKIVDFGISKAGGKGARLVAKELDFLGSPAYMSPEQIVMPDDVDARSDIWSIGVTLYELVSGRLPFPAASVGQVCANVLARAPRPLREVRPDVPVQLETIILKCLQKKRDDRFPNVATLAEALRALGLERRERSLLPAAEPLGSALVDIDVKSTRRTEPAPERALEPARASGSPRRRKARMLTFRCRS